MTEPLSAAANADPERSETPHVSYDDTPYFNSAYPQTHIGFLSATARLFGHAAPDPRAARVLEIGCAAGGNLLPMALEFPGASFVGVDLDARLVEAGRKAAESCDAANLRLLAADIADYTPEQPFDYIIAHGVYSWVSPGTADAVLALIGRHLAPGGVGYVSYNAYPGWHLRRIVHDLLQYHAEAHESPQAKLEAAATILKVLQDQGQNQKNAYWEAVRQETDLLRRQDISYLLQEHFESENHPAYFHEFVDRAQGHGLAFLSETDLVANALSVKYRFRDQVCAGLAGGADSDRLRQEQYFDFLQGRSFRQTMVARAEDLPAVPTAPTEDAVWDLYLRPLMTRKKRMAALDHSPAVYISVRGQEITVHGATAKALFETLLDEGHAGLDAATLFERANGMLASAGHKTLERGAFLTQACSFVMSGCFEARTTPFPAGRALPERPRTSTLVRHFAATQLNLPTLNHQTVECTAPEQQLLRLLDGSRNRNDLLNAMMKVIAEGVLSFRGADGKVLEDFNRVSQLFDAMLDPMLDDLRNKGFIAKE